jgi:glycerophosphoryl diester phosphodiesterase
MTLRRLAAALALATIAAPAAAATFSTLSGNAPIVIAHRGASGYLPEHTLGAYELGMRMGADYIEPDLQLTADGHLVAMHDTTLTRTTDVEALFPGRSSYAVIDFTLAEIRTLTVKPTAATAATSYPGFTPSAPEPFRVPTFAEVLAFLNAYNAANGTTIGVYPEAKTPNPPAINRQIVEDLKAAGFTAPEDGVFIQSFSYAFLEGHQPPAGGSRDRPEDRGAGRAGPGGRRLRDARGRR